MPVGENGTLLTNTQNTDRRRDQLHPILPNFITGFLNKSDRWVTRKRKKPKIDGGSVTTG
jgi:hypothetical protein